MKAKKIQASQYDLLEYYMVFGGVPFYWSLLTRGQSVAQNVDKLIFAEEGKLHYEFSTNFTTRCSVTLRNMSES